MSRFELFGDYKQLYNPYLENNLRGITFRYNYDWINRFLESCGFRYHRFDGVSAGEVIKSMIRVYGGKKEYNDVMVYSTDMMMGQFSSGDRIKLFRPKVISRSFAHVMNESEVSAKFGVDKFRKDCLDRVFSRV